ncbi:hypothetical protein ACHAWO_006573 [Cyclotella atomus]|uniref:Uncharacterized protein n=1 Tax=Cyclotella atomus TaxID=382360 RepID=A0ABD3NHI9_9STRA
MVKSRSDTAPLASVLCLLLRFPNIKKTIASTALTAAFVLLAISHLSKSLDHSQRKASSSTFTSASRSIQPTPVSVFYNAYFPPGAATDDSVKEKILDILREQMRQVGIESVLAGRDNVVVRTVTIGAQLDYATIIAEACAEINLECTHEGHHDKGFEMVTQQHLLEYCQVPENESHIVGYIHNKGSFHPSPAQHRMRRGMTADALSEYCMTNLDSTATAANTCNVCGHAFRSAWGPMMWANFWSARCDYVKNLVSPFSLQERNTFAFEHRPQQMTTDLFNEHATMFSLPTDERFAAEIFVGTHPKLVPCSKNSGREWWSGDPPVRFRDLILAHEVPFHINGKTYEQYMDDLESDGHQLTDYWMLPGMLWRYHVLYNEMPPEDSWIWRHYPDGEKWQQKVQAMGYPRAFYHRYAENFEQQSRALVGFD